VPSTPVYDFGSGFVWSSTRYTTVGLFVSMPMIGSISGYLTRAGLSVIESKTSASAETASQREHAAPGRWEVLALQPWCRQLTRVGRKGIGVS